MKTTTQQIGAAGELLVQYKLLKMGIDSARLSTDFGIDLVAYSPKSQKAFSIQVKTKEKPVKAGGTGKMSLDWYLKNKTPADIIATTDLSENKVWLFSIEEFRKLAQQHSGKDILHLYMYVETPNRTKHEKSLVEDFNDYLLENKAEVLFR